jgi:hypothetical protein
MLLVTNKKKNHFVILRHLLSVTDKNISDIVSCNQTQ